MDDTLHLEALRRRAEGGEPLQFLFFWDHAARADTLPGRNCLSQWFEAPFTAEGLVYSTAEHFMMAAKAALFGDEALRRLILRAATPGEAQALGREVRGFSEAVWAAHRFGIVLRANLKKFSQRPTLREYLLSTGDAVLAQASPFDPLWGTGLTASHPDAYDPRRWRGLNLLGFALIGVREVLRERG